MSDCLHLPRDALSVRTFRTQNARALPIPRSHVCVNAVVKRGAGQLSVGGKGVGQVSVQRCVVTDARRRRRLTVEEPIRVCKRRGGEGKKRKMGRGCGYRVGEYARGVGIWEAKRGGAVPSD